jgi:hypothetical protein
VALMLIALSPWAAQLGEAAPACPIKSISGFPCPTCGTTRAAVALARLDVLAAVDLNPLVALAWMSLVAGGLVALAGVLAGKRLPALPARLSLSQRTAVVAVVAVNWLYLIAAGT